MGFPSAVINAWNRVVENIDEALAAPAFVGDGVARLASLAKVTDSEMRVFLVLVFAYLAGFIWRKLPGPTPKHIFSVVTGILMCQFVIGSAWMHIINLAGHTYLWMSLFGPRAALFNFIFCMGFLAAGHLYRLRYMYLDWTIDWTLPTMIIVQKCVAIHYNYYDGVANRQATPEQRHRSLQKLPSLLEFFSFVFFPAGVIMGPGFEFVDYKAFAEDKIKHPPPVVPSLIRFGEAIGLLAFHTIMTAYLPTLDMLRDEKFLRSGTLLSRWVAIYLSLMGYKAKYYFGWYFSEGAVRMSGLGYNGTESFTSSDGKVVTRDKWDRVENIDIAKFEGALSVRDSTSAWNTTTNVWLRRYVYERFGKPPVNIYITTFVSAVWHGFYPGYYMFFVGCAVLVQLHRMIRKSVRPLFFNASGEGAYRAVYNFVAWFVTVQLVHYFILSFIVLSFWQAVRVYRSLYFFGHVAVAVVAAAFALGLMPPQQKVAPAQPAPSRPKVN